MTPTTQAPRHRGLLILNIVSQLAFGLLAMTISIPSMQDWPAVFGATQASVQLTFSLYVAAFGAMQLVYGAVSDRIGRKPVLLVGVAIGVAGSALAAMAPNLWVLTAARVLQGAGCAAGIVVGRAIVQDLFSGPERTRVLAFIGMTMGLCPPTAMLVGGQLHVRFGWQAPFVAMTVLGMVLIVTGWRWLPATRSAAPTPAGNALGALARGYGQLLREPRFLLYAGILALTAGTFYTFLGGAPLVLAGYRVSPERIGLYVMAVPLAYIIGNGLTSRLIQRWGDQKLMLIGHTCTVTGIATLLVLGVVGVHTPLMLSLPLVLVGIGHGLLMPPTLGGTVGLVPALAGSAAAVAGVMQQTLGAAGGMAVGLVPHAGPVNLALQMMGWAATALVFQIMLRRVLLRRAH